MTRRTLFQSLCALLAPWGSSAPVVRVFCWASRRWLERDNIYHAPAMLPEDGDPALSEIAESADVVLEELLENPVYFRTKLAAEVFDGRGKVVGI